MLQAQQPQLHPLAPDIPLSAVSTLKKELERQRADAPRPTANQLKDQRNALLKDLGIDMTLAPGTVHGSVSALSHSSAEMRTRSDILKAASKQHEKLEKVIAQFVTYERDQRLIAHAKQTISVPQPLKMWLVEDTPTLLPGERELADFFEDKNLDNVTEEAAWLAQYSEIVRNWYAKNVPLEDRYDNDRQKEVAGLRLLGGAIERRKIYLDSKVNVPRSLERRSTIILEKRMARRFPPAVEWIQRRLYSIKMTAGQNLLWMDLRAHMEKLFGLPPMKDRFILERMGHGIKRGIAQWLHPKPGPEERPDLY